MTITDVRVKLAADFTPGDSYRGADGAQARGRLLAFCSITLDGCFVVRDLKLIRGADVPFVAMPSRKITARCGCGGKNALKARFCADCGVALSPPSEEHQQPCATAPGGRIRLYADIAHPITGSCRRELERTVVAAYERERALAVRPGYVCRYDEIDFGEPAPARTAPPLRPPAAPPTDGPSPLDSDPDLAATDLILQDELDGDLAGAPAASSAPMEAPAGRTRRRDPAGRVPRPPSAGAPAGRTTQHAAAARGEFGEGV